MDDIRSSWMNIVFLGRPVAVRKICTSPTGSALSVEFLESGKWVFLKVFRF
jgi:hypothetical protein